MHCSLCTTLRSLVYHCAASLWPHSSLCLCCSRCCARAGLLSPTASMTSRRPHHAGAASTASHPKALGSFASSASSSASAASSPTHAHAHAAALAPLPPSGGSFFPLLSDPAALHNEKERVYYQSEDHKIALTLSQMDRCQELTDAMLGILDSFDDKLGALESSMLPIHKGTQALMTAQKNIDATLAETDKIILHYRIATESESSIESHLLNAIDYVSYLEWVERIHLSINFFTVRGGGLVSDCASVIVVCSSVRSPLCALFARCWCSPIRKTKTSWIVAPVPVQPVAPTVSLPLPPPLHRAPRISEATVRM